MILKSLSLIFFLYHLEIICAEVNYDYGACLKNVNATKTAYIEEFQAYFEFNYRWFDAAAARLEPRLKSLPRWNDHSHALCQVDEYVQNIYTFSCRVPNIDDSTYTPNFDGYSDEQVCLWIGSTGKYFHYLNQLRYNALVSCNIDAMFDAYIERHGICIRYF